jgi:myosin heavy subunit
MAVAGDLVMHSADFPMADKLAERLEKTLPPELRDEKPGQQQQVPPEVQQKMQQHEQQIQQLSQALEAAAGHAEQLEAESKSHKEEVEVKRIEANTKAYEAITKRLSMLGPLLSDIEVRQLAAETQREAMEQPDPGRPPAESMGVPEQLPEPMEYQEPQNLPNTQPATAGFSLPQEGQVS